MAAPIDTGPPCPIEPPVRFSQVCETAVCIGAKAAPPPPESPQIIEFSGMHSARIVALISAAINDPSVVYFFDAKAASVLIPLVVLAVLSNWSTCDACLYNASMGFTNVFPAFNWRSAAVFGTVIGLIAAATGIIGNIVNWLILLGLLVPPIGGAIIADYYVVRREKGFSVGRDAAINWAAIISLVVGVVIGYWVHVTFPNFLFGAAGIITSFVAYVILAKVAASSRKPTPCTRPEKKTWTRPMPAGVVGGEFASVMAVENGV